MASRNCTSRSLVVAVLGLAGCIIDEFPVVTEGEPETGSTTGEPTGSGTTGSSGEPTGGSTGEPVLCPEHASVDDCCCFAAQMGGAFGDVKNVCGAEMLCPAVDFQCQDAGPDAACGSVGSEGDLDCVLVALAGAGAGKLQITFAGGDVWNGRTELFLRGDGSAYTIRFTRVAETNEFAPTGSYVLQPPEFFQQCASKSVAEKADCVRQALVAEASEVCVEGFSFNDVI